MTRKFPIRFAVVLVLSVLCALSTAVFAFETKAKQALIIEAGSGIILFSKNADDLVPPASLAKMMTMETVFHAIDQGTVKLDDVYPVSENAWRTGGAPSGSSTMFAALKSQIRLEDLIRGAIVQSANDGCIIIVEGMAGSEPKFVELMNRRASEIGLQKSVFKTEESGDAIVGSAVRGKTRLFVAMSGMATDKERAEEARKMLAWGFDGFNRSELFAEGIAVGSAKVFGGEKSRVALKAAGPVSLLVPVGNEEKVFARIVYQGPIVAPVKAGTLIGALNVRVGNTIVQETPLLAAEDVAVGSLHQRALDAVGSGIADGLLAIVTARPGVYDGRIDAKHCFGASHDNGPDH